jgi:hypothetical protein
MFIEAVSFLAAIGSGAIALYVVVRAKEAQLKGITLIKDAQLAEKDRRIAKLENRVDELLAYKDEISRRQDEKIAALERRIDNKDDKAETMLGEIADLKGDLNFERGIYARPEADALQEQKIDRIEHEPNPLDDTTEKPKRGGKR